MEYDGTENKLKGDWIVEVKGTLKATPHFGTEPKDKIILRYREAFTDGVNWEEVGEYFETDRFLTALVELGFFNNVTGEPHDNVTYRKWIETVNEDIVFNTKTRHRFEVGYGDPFRIVMCTHKNETKATGEARKLEKEYEVPFMVYDTWLDRPIGEEVEERETDETDDTDNNTNNNTKKQRDQNTVPEWWNNLKVKRRKEITEQYRLDEKYAYMEWVEVSQFAQMALGKHYYKYGSE